MRRLPLILALMAVIALVVTVSLLLVAPRPAGSSWMEVTFHRPGWDRVSVLTDDPGVLKAVIEELDSAPRSDEQPAPDDLDLYVVRIHLVDGQDITLWVTEHGRVYDPGPGHYIYGPALSSVLSPHVHRLRRQFFGEPAYWGDVHRTFHYDTVAEIEDLETGRRFSVFRFGGIDHADMEPLTALDSAIMRDIYGGEWSWRRRAVILHLDGRRLAASMTGMPHMGYKIDDNDFEGHFCLHFDGSVIHGPRNVDTAHHIMYKKAAGLVGEIVSEPDPGLLAVYMLTALGHGDAQTALAMLKPGPGVAEAGSNLASAADGLYADPAQILKQDDDRATVQVSFSLYVLDPPGERRVSVVLELERAGPGEPWLIDPGFLSDLRP